MSNSIHEAAAVGDPDVVRRFVTENGALASLKDERGWDPLTCLCFSVVLRKEPSRAGAFLDAARSLLNAGASANTGYYDNSHQPTPMLESALYGAAGVARNAALTRLLLQHGADPNDDEVPYHAPETFDNAAVEALLDSGRLNADSLATMLLRKCDWHDYHGIRLLLHRGADPSRMTRWGYTALHQAIRRDNDVLGVRLLLRHGADPAIRAHGQSAAALAAWEGRGDVLRLFERRCLSFELQGAERLLAACARNDAAIVRSLAAREPAVVAAMLTQQGYVLGEFAGIGNTDGVGHLLDLGADICATVVTRDGYWGIATDSMPLHVAAWRAQHATVKLLIERGAPVNAPDGKGRTPLMLAVGACVDSYWTDRRSPESVKTLLCAGATKEGIAVPTGYDAIDALLR